MRPFVELCAKGGRRLFVETAAISGVMTSPNKGKHDMATPESPITLILRNALPIEIIGIEPVMLFAQMCMVAEKVDNLKDTEHAPAVVIQFLDRDDGTE